jgi:hypothetical protein
MANVAIPPASLSRSNFVNTGGAFADVPARQRPRMTTVCGLLALVMLLTLAAMSAYAHRTHGTAGVWAAVIAVGVCWVASTAALILSASLAGTAQALQGQLGSILLRTVLPLVSAIVLEKQVPWLAEAGIFGMMVPAYLVSLAAETLLSLWFAGPARSVAKAS